MQSGAVVPSGLITLSDSPVFSVGGREPAVKPPGLFRAIMRPLVGSWHRKGSIDRSGTEGPPLPQSRCARPPGSVSVNVGNAGPVNPLSALPADLHRRIVASAAPADCIALAGADPRRIYPNIVPEVRAASISLAPPVEELGAFRKQLSEAKKDLLDSAQQRALTELGARILGLSSEHDQRRACRAFVNAVGKLRAKSALLGGLHEAASKGVQGLRCREQKVMRTPDVPRAVFQALGYEGKTIRDVANTLGVCLEDSINELEWIAVESLGYPAVDRNVSAKDVAQALGIRHPDNIARLKYREAEFEVRRGNNIGAVVQSLGISDEQFVDSLQAVAFDGPAQRRVREGEDPRLVASALGINDESYIDALMWLRRATASVEAGASSGGARGFGQST